MLVTAGLCATGTVAAQEECENMGHAIPAQLIVDERTRELVADLVSPWKSDEPARIISFGAYIDDTGRFEGACCFSSTFRMSQTAEGRLAQRLKQLRFDPAHLGRNPMRVYVGFTIVARKAGDDVVTDLVMNRLKSVREFGSNYLAPQRVWRAAMWPDSRRVGGAVYLEVEADVDETGKATGTRIVDETNNARTVSGILASRVDSSCFVPGYVNGEPTAMIYSERFSNEQR